MESGDRDVYHAAAAATTAAKTAGTFATATSASTCSVYTTEMCCRRFAGPGLHFDGAVERESYVVFALRLDSWVGTPFTWSVAGTNRSTL